MTLSEACKTFRAEFTPELTIPQAACIAGVKPYLWRHVEEKNRTTGFVTDLRRLCLFLGLSADEQLGLDALRESAAQDRAQRVERFLRTGDPKPEFFCGLPTD